MKRLLAALVVAVLAMLIAPATASAAPSPYPCKGAEDFTTTASKAWAWNFNEPNGSRVFKESLRRDPADDLTVLPQYRTPYASGDAIWFNDDAVLSSKGNIFNPENRDFAACVKFLDNPEDDSCNVWQIGNRHAVPSTIGELKITPWYGHVESTQQRFFLRTGMTTMHGVGYKTITIARRGNWFDVYVDGVSIHHVLKSGGLQIHLTQVLAVGGKIEGDGLPTATSDMLDGRVAFVGMFLK